MHHEHLRYISCQQPRGDGSGPKKHFPDKHLNVHPGEWLLSASGTAKAICDKLEVTDGTTGSAMVFSTTNYFGRAKTDIWDWVKVEAEAAGD